MVDVIESVKKLDVGEHSIIVLRCAQHATDSSLQVVVEELSEWLRDQGLHTVQIFIVSGEGFDLSIISNHDMNECGWYRKDDL